MNWKNKTVVITGGTSGLGLALVESLYHKKARIVVVARTLTELNKLKNMYPNIICIQGDVSNKNAIYAIASEIELKFGSVDVLFNVASYLGETPLKLLLDTECEDFELVLQTNLLGPFRLMKVLLPGMLFKNSGIIINISSDAAVKAYPRWGSYSVSKTALDHLTRVFNEELKGKGIHFLSIDPGDMNTPMHFAAIPDADKSLLKNPLDSAQAIIKLISDAELTPVRRTLW